MTLLCVLLRICNRFNRLIRHTDMCRLGNISQVPDPVKQPIERPFDLLTNTVAGFITTGAPGTPGLHVGDASNRKLFRIRGFSWFKAHIAGTATAASVLVPKIAERKNSRPAWAKWGSNYAPRHISDAMRTGRPAPLILERALQTILLCELNAEAVGMTAKDIHDNMRIEPAAFVIQGFNKKVLETAEIADAGLWGRLYGATFQTTSDSINEMAKQVPVSFRLASRVRSVLMTIEGLPIGDVITQIHGRVGAAEVEDVDGPSEPPFDPPA